MRLISIQKAKISEFKGKYKFGDPIETSLGIISINKTQYWNEKYR